MESNCVHLCGEYVYLTNPENDDIITIGGNCPLILPEDCDQAQ